MPVATPQGPEHRRRARRGLSRLLWPSRSALAICLITCVAIPVLLVGLMIHSHPKLSPVDEGAHIDYVLSVTHSDLPALGQPLRDDTMRLIVCTGVDLRGIVLPPCNQKVLVPSDLPGAGQQYEAQQPPGYYVLTAPVRWIDLHVLGMGELTALRTTGIVWLVAGLLLLWAAGRVIGLAPRLIGAATLLLATAAPIIISSAYVNNDAASIVGASAVLLVGALAWTRPGRWCAPVAFVTGAAVASLKATDAVPALVVAALLALVGYFGPSGEDRTRSSARQVLRRWLPTGGALVAGALFAVVAWTIFTRLHEVVAPRDIKAFNVLRGSTFRSNTILTEALSQLLPLNSNPGALMGRTGVLLGRSGVPATLLAQLTSVVSSLFSYALLAGSASIAFVTVRRWYHWLGALTLAGLYLGGIALGYSVWFTYHSDPSLHGRYALSLSVLLVVALVTTLRGRRALIALYAYGATALALDTMLLVFR